MLDRPAKDLPQNVSVYTSGFPCQPFSLLNNGSALLEDPRAAVFFATMKTVYRCSPLIGVLENVLGLTRCWPQVQEQLDKLTNYYYCKIIIDPYDLGDPVRRRRYYILLINKSLEKIYF